MLQFVVPANSHAVFAWEDPVLQSGFRDYAIFASKENMLFQQYQKYMAVKGKAWEMERTAYSQSTTKQDLI